MPIFLAATRKVGALRNDDGRKCCCYCRVRVVDQPVRNPTAMTQTMLAAIDAQSARENISSTMRKPKRP